MIPGNDKVTVVWECTGATAAEEARRDSGMPDRDRANLAYALGVQAYIYGYPVVVMEQIKETMLRTKAPLNQFYYSTAQADPDFKDIVSPNSNTLYLSAWLDLAQGPVILHVPANPDNRYFTIQMLDIYTNTFCNVSRRTTAGMAARYAIVGPSWKGAAPIAAIRAPTRTVWLIGRVEVRGEADLSRAVDFEKQFVLTPIGGGTACQSHESAWTLRTYNPLQFFALMTEAIRYNPPPPCDYVLLDQFKPIGIDARAGFNPRVLDPAAVAGLTRASIDAQSIIQSVGKAIPTDNGWTIAYGVGTYGDQFLLRAYIAYSGIGANVPTEELYARAFVDGEGRQLSGAYRYVLHFQAWQIPEARAFWSLTMYGADFYLVPNAIGRYSIGSLNPGLQYERDGSLIVYLQQDPPSHKVSNWLPAPAGQFNLIIRMFEPTPRMLDGTYRLPPIERLTIERP